MTTSTIGLGLGYDESLLASLARGGAGNTHFAEEGDTAAAALASEVDGLLTQVVQAASLTVRPTGAVESVTLFNDLPTVGVEGGFMVELGDFHSGEHRKLLLEIEVPAMAALGLAQVCELELLWVELATMDTHKVDHPGERQRRAWRRGGGPDGQPGRVDRARVPAGAARQAGCDRRVARRRDGQSAPAVQQRRSTHSVGTRTRSSSWKPMCSTTWRTGRSTTSPCGQRSAQWPTGTGRPGGAGQARPDASWRCSWAVELRPAVVEFCERRSAECDSNVTS